jgi:uncharacterized protein YprB with RNaseH-like and TPR domain
VRQFFLNGPAGEHALLDGLGRILGAASLLVTYNGRAFDVPVMETRWAYHRQENRAEALPHFDMLPVARRLWGGTAEGCALAALERSVLRVHRLNDVPGLEIPSRYFQFLRTGDPSVIDGYAAGAEKMLVRALESFKKSKYETHPHAIIARKG